MNKIKVELSPLKMIGNIAVIGFFICGLSFKKNKLNIEYYFMNTLIFLMTLYLIYILIIIVFGFWYIESTNGVITVRKGIKNLKINKSDITKIEFFEVRQGFFTNKYLGFNFVENFNLYKWKGYDFWIPINLKMKDSIEIFLKEIEEK